MQNPRDIDELITQVTDIVSSAPVSANLAQRIVWLVSAVEQLRATRTLHMVWDETNTLTCGGIIMGRVTRARAEVEGWVYSSECDLPGVVIPSMLLPLQKAREKLELEINQWFNRASRAPGAGLGLEGAAR